MYLFVMIHKFGMGFCKIYMPRVHILFHQGSYMSSLQHTCTSLNPRDKYLYQFVHVYIFLYETAPMMQVHVSSLLIPLI